MAHINWTNLHPSEFALLIHHSTAPLVCADYSSRYWRFGTISATLRRHPQSNRKGTQARLYRSLRLFVGWFQIPQRIEYCPLYRRVGEISQVAALRENRQLPRSKGGVKPCQILVSQ